MHATSTGWAAEALRLQLAYSPSPQSGVPLGVGSWRDDQGTTARRHGAYRVDGLGDVWLFLEYLDDVL